MKEALEEANLDRSEVDYLNAHATSTSMGDRSEMAAVATFFGRDQKLNISSTKSMTGHLLGGAGAIEALTCIMAINHGVVPPTINLENKDTEIADYLNLTPNHAIKRDVRVAMSNTFGFGGHNTTAVFKRFEE